MEGDLSLKEIQREWHGTLKAYIIGFFLSLLLTSAAFFLVANRFLSAEMLMYTVMALAVVQAIVQLLFFLHVGQEAKPKWETIIFCFTVLTLLIIIIGSLWIMHDLDHRVMPGMAREMPHD